MPEQAPGNYEVFTQAVNAELSTALNEAAYYVTNNIDLVVNGQTVGHPFEGTYTTAAIIAGAKTAEDGGHEILAAASAKQESEHLEETMGYGNLSPIAFKKAHQLIGIAEKVPAEKLRTSDPQTAVTLLDSGVGRAFMGASRIDRNPARSENTQKFVVGTSGGEGSRELIQAMFPGEKFDFDANPTELERGAGLLDELVSRMIGGVMVLKALGIPFGDQHIRLELTDLQQDTIAKTESDIGAVPGNLNQDGSSKITIN